MKRLILSSILLILAACFALPLKAQKTKNIAKSRKTREVTIYVYQQPPETSGEFYGKIIPVKRKIVDHEPLSQALKLLLKGANEAETKQNLESFIFELDFVAARIKNGTAQIHFKFQNPSIALESWEGGGFDRENFNLAVEQTARQFPEVKRVSFCISGKKGYTTEEPVGKCPFKMFPSVALPSLPKK